MRFAWSGLCAVLLLAVTSPGVSAISLTDYRFPLSTSQQAYLNGSFSSNDANDAGQVGYNVGGAGIYDLYHRSLPFSYELHASANASA